MQQPLVSQAFQSFEQFENVHLYNRQCVLNKAIDKQIQQIATISEQTSPRSGRVQRRNDLAAKQRAYHNQNEREVYKESSVRGIVKGGRYAATTFRRFVCFADGDKMVATSSRILKQKE